MSRCHPSEILSSADDTSPGFTLVELLVALTLMALLAVMLMGNLRFGMRAVTAAGATFDRSSQIAVAEGFLRNTLSNAQSIPDPTAPGRGLSIVFDGKPDQIEFATLPPAYLANGFHQLTISLVGEGHARSLIVTWRLIARGPASSNPPELAPSVLIDEISTAEFAYCCNGSSATEIPDGAALAPPQWIGRWPGTYGLPSLIRLHLVFADGRQWRDLLVAPRQANLPAIAK